MRNHDFHRNELLIDFGRLIPDLEQAFVLSGVSDLRVPSSEETGSCHSLQIPEILPATEPGDPAALLSQHIFVCATASWN